jgi:hypothetical protein
MKYTVLALALFVQCWFSAAAAQTWPPKLSPADADNPVIVVIHYTEVASSVRDSVPYCGVPECYRIYLLQKLEEISAVAQEAVGLTTEEEKGDFLSKNFWFKTAQLRVASHRMCKIGGDDGCVLYAKELLIAVNEASKTERKSPSEDYLAAEVHMLTDKSCVIQTGRCLLETPIEYLDAACERSSGEACFTLAEKWAIVELLGMEKSRTHEDVMARACDLDNSSSCWSIVKKDLGRTSAWTQETVDLAMKSCLGGIKDACLLISHSRKHGKLGMSAAPEEAMQFLAQTYCTMLEFSDVQCDMKFKEL